MNKSYKWLLLGGMLSCLILATVYAVSLNANVSLEEVSLAPVMAQQLALAFEPPEKTQQVIFEMYIRKYNHKVFPALAQIEAEAFIRAGEEFGIPPVFLLALTQVESSFNYMAVSNKECVGLLQINPTVWLQNKDNVNSLVKAGIAEHIQDLFDPIVNIRAGAHILKVYMTAAKKQNLQDPLRYALTRYYGGVKNSHPEKFEVAVGNFYIYNISLEL